MPASARFSSRRLSRPIEMGPCQVKEIPVSKLFAPPLYEALAQRFLKQ